MLLFSFSLTERVFPNISVLRVMHYQKNPMCSQSEESFHTPGIPCPYTKIITHFRKIFPLCGSPIVRFSGLCRLQIFSQLVTKPLNIHSVVQDGSSAISNSFCKNISAPTVEQLSTLANSYMFFKGQCPSPHFQAASFFLGLRQPRMCRQASPTDTQTVYYKSLEISHIALM